VPARRILHVGKPSDKRGKGLEKKGQRTDSADSLGNPGRVQYFVKKQFIDKIQKSWRPSKGG
jgi:hypothetical protein